jgi:hypothetical protein
MTFKLDLKKLAEHVESAGPMNGDTFLKTMDDWAAENQKWEDFRNKALLDFLREQGFDSPVKDPVQLEAVRKRGQLEKFPGGNWEQFFKWDGKRVLHFAGRPRMRDGKLMRIIRRLP